MPLLIFLYLFVTHLSYFLNGHLVTAACLWPSSCSLLELLWLPGHENRAGESFHCLYTYEGCLDFHRSFAMKPRNYLPSAMLWALCFLQDSGITGTGREEMGWWTEVNGWSQWSQDMISYQLSTSTQNLPTSIWLCPPVSLHPLPAIRPLRGLHFTREPCSPHPKEWPLRVCKF